jgi:hypothetical protein
MINKILLFTLIAALLTPVTGLADMYLGASVGNSWFSQYRDEREDVEMISWLIRPQNWRRTRS